LAWAIAATVTSPLPGAWTTFTPSMSADPITLAASITGIRTASRCPNSAVWRQLGRGRPSPGDKTVAMRTAAPALDDFDAWVHRLGDPVRATHAYRHLVTAGNAARPAVVRGLQSSNADTRLHCARALDQLVDESSYPMLIAALDDHDSRVRREALHALACDRCKSDRCRPNVDDVLPKAIQLLLYDADAHVRAQAVELVGRFVHTNSDAEQALSTASSTDLSPAVRKKAGWYAPGGVIYARSDKRNPDAITRGHSEP
jgi:HEAT repeat protein